MLKYLLVLWCSLYATSGFTWSAVGHRVVGQIAYDNLTPKAKRYFAHLNQSLNKNHRYYSLISATVWFDGLYDQHLLSLKPIHYIDIPFSMDQSPVPKVSSRNAVSAMVQARCSLLNNTLPDLDKAVALRILLHVVGDVHQPLHAATRVSYEHPQGDRGGNDFKLGKNKVAPNLHRYWDQGGGLLSPKMSTVQVRILARNLEQDWPCQVESFSPMNWANESHEIAMKYAYDLEEHTIPSNDYESNTQSISKQQLAHAGCRLAALLNQSAEGADNEAITCPKNRVASPPVTAL